MESERRYCEISKEMSFFLDVFCQSKLESQNGCRAHFLQLPGEGGGGCMSNSRTLASIRQNTACPKYNDDISLLISQYFFISVWSSRHELGIFLLRLEEGRPWKVKYDYKISLKKWRKWFLSRNVFPIIIGKGYHLIENFSEYQLNMTKTILVQRQFRSCSIFPNYLEVI